jgi:hypothetical protein
MLRFAAGRRRVRTLPGASAGFFSFAPQNDQISSTWIRLHGKFRSASFWYRY